MTGIGGNEPLIGGTDDEVQVLSALRARSTAGVVSIEVYSARMTACSSCEHNVEMPSDARVLIGEFLAAATMCLRSGGETSRTALMELARCPEPHPSNSLLSRWGDAR